MTGWERARLAASVAALSWVVHAAGSYPLTLTIDARAADPRTAVSSQVTITVDRLMEESRRKKVTDALTYNGYPGFVTALRTLPQIGTITLRSREVIVRYAHETREADSRRIVVIADRPLFFLGDEQVKPRRGYELTLAELRIDGAGAVTGRMLGAARVKLSPDGVVLDDYADVEVQLGPSHVKP